VNHNRFSQKIEDSKLLGAIHIVPPEEALLNEFSSLEKLIGSGKKKDM
jgi:hypothetical protein